MTRHIHIQGHSVVCSLGIGPQQVAEALFAPAVPALQTATLCDGRAVRVAAVDLPVSDLRRENGAAETRNNRLADLALLNLPAAARDLLQSTDPARVGVVIGTSTSGIDAGGGALRSRLSDGGWPADFDLSVQELGDPALFLAQRIGATGPAYSVSTACTSGAKAIIAGARMVRTGMCDVVLCGGVDTLCDMTLNGFGVLEALSNDRCNPFSANRDGIHIGEGAGLFVLSADPAAVRIAGWGESSDAYHISAPDPDGAGARLAMQGALHHAGLTADAIDYLNLHGTATVQNDRMEAAAVNAVLGAAVPCSSTKALTGHTLGAAGAVEAALTLMALTTGKAPANRNDGAVDPDLAPLGLLSADAPVAGRAVMTCNYAFGGNNTALVLALS